MSIRLHCEGRRTVPKALLHDLERSVDQQQVTRVTVPQVVEPDPRELRLLQHPRQIPLSDIVRVVRLSVPLAKD